MKRSLTLVSYSSSDEEQDIDVVDNNKRTRLDISLSTSQHTPRPPLTKKRLPSLPPTIAPLPPPGTCNPSKHQGRVRTRPFVEGEWAAYVYVPVCLGPGKRGKLGNLVRDVVKKAQEDVPALHGIVGEVVEQDNDGLGNDQDEQARKTEGELHISLSRPIYLRAHQRDELRRAVRELSHKSVPFIASFASFTELTNDERTRVFLAMEVGAGYERLKALSDALAPTLTFFRQKTYYENPRYHASFSWALLDTTTIPEDNGPLVVEPPNGYALLSAPSTPALPSSIAHSSDHFPKIPHLPPTLVQKLNEEFQQQLLKRDVGTFEVEEVCVRIGKDIGRWKLGG